MGGFGIDRYINAHLKRNCFKEYSVLAMVSKKRQRPMTAYYNFFYNYIASLLDSKK